MQSFHTIVYYEQREGKAFKLSDVLNFSLISMMIQKKKKKGLGHSLCNKKKHCLSCTQPVAAVSIFVIFFNHRSNPVMITNHACYVLISPPLWRKWWRLTRTSGSCAHTVVVCLSVASFFCQCLALGLCI